MSSNLDPRARPAIGKLSVYIPGKPLTEVQRELGLTDLAKLASNENTLGPSPKALAAIQAALGELNYYPDNGHFELKEAFARHLQVPTDWLAVGAGGTPLLKWLAEAYVRPGDKVVFPWPSFAMYPFYAQLMEAEAVAVPLTADGRQDLEAMARAAQGARLLFVCNPNNPTGTYVNRTDLEAFLARIGPETLVVLDEAYFDYARDAAADYPDGIDWVRRGAGNVVVLRTLSKIFGLAGLRVATLAGQPEVVQSVRRVREPFQLNNLAQVAGTAALSDHDFIRTSLQVVARGRRQLEATADELGLKYLPSVANFVYMEAGAEANAVSDALLRHGIIVRPNPPPSDWMRVTVGTEEQNDRFGRALAAVLAEMRR